LAEAQQYRSEKLKQEPIIKRNKDGSLLQPQSGKGIQRGASKTLVKEGSDSNINPFASIGNFTTFDITGLPGTNLLSSIVISYTSLLILFLCIYA
jgi:hypothetical protein